MGGRDNRTTDTTIEASALRFEKGNDLAVRIGEDSLDVRYDTSIKCIAFETEATTLTRILEHTGGRTTAPVLSPARGPAAWEEMFDQSPVFDPTPAAPGPVFEFDHTVTWQRRAWTLSELSCLCEAQVAPSPPCACSARPLPRRTNPSRLTLPPPGSFRPRSSRSRLTRGAVRSKL